MNTLGIYIHIPFCKSKCHYCNFNSYANLESLVSKYILALEKEILDNTEVLSSIEVVSIYFGGGTPSYISSNYIMNLIKSCSNISKDAEITIEINPGNITEDKIQCYLDCGINRFSIGLQDTNNNILKQIGRSHTFEDYTNLTNILKSKKIKNFSTDIIYGLPSQTPQSIKESIEILIANNTPHISVYGLEVHEESKLKFLIDNNYLSLPDEDTEMDIKYTLENLLEKNGYIRYEISNYAKPGFNSKHNLGYWNQNSYLGFGASASSYINSTRYTNISSVHDYINSIENNLNVHIDIEEMDLLDTMKEYVILQLRLIDGVNIQKFYNKFKTDIYCLFGTEIKKLTELSLIETNDTNIYLTNKGKDLANLVWQEFI